ncbi:hypothetical protein V500_02699 [Pseudogymnoascus sp. VKM F-4518 (FW-2643)]|nr:hypothetical protein V500_02699 [Pseudogymnoascus sp. VKM F-4518 (FW-2643)]
MLALAAKNLSKSALTNVSFVKAPITATTLPSGEADCIISNCVINLVPGADKALVFSEIWRLLRPGGRVAVSDILARKELSLELKGHLGLYVGCISGASLVGEYEGWLRGVGFQDVLIVDKKSDLNIYKERADSEEKGCGAPAEGSSSCCGTRIPITEKGDVANIDFNEWVGSFEVYAVKPADAHTPPLLVVPPPLPPIPAPPPLRRPQLRLVPRNAFNPRLYIRVAPAGEHHHRSSLRRLRDSAAVIEGGAGGGGATGGAAQALVAAAAGAGVVGGGVNVLAVDVDGVGAERCAAVLAVGVALLEAEELELGLDAVDEAHCWERWWVSGVVGRVGRGE